MIEEFYKYSRISWEYLNEIWDRIRCRKMLIGGWAVHLLVNEKLKEIKKKDYIGSKDIDIFVKNRKETEKVLRNMGFKRENKRYFKRINDFKLYVDIFDSERNIDPFINTAFFKNYILKIGKFIVPLPEFLIVSKLYTIQTRGIKEKRLKDILDFLMLISFTKYDVSLLKELIGKSHIYEKIIFKEIEEGSYLLKYFDFSEEEIRELVKTVKKILEII